MKLIIDIPEETYKEVCWRGLHLCPKDENNLVRAIKNSTTLDDVTEAISEKYANTHYMYPEYASGLTYAYGIIDRCVRKAESEET